MHEIHNYAVIHVLAWPLSQRLLLYLSVWIGISGLDNKLFLKASTHNQSVLAQLVSLLLCVRY